MKYLKLFENFQGEDPKWILISALEPIEVTEVTFDEKYGDTSMVQIFGLSEMPTDEKLNHLKSWLKDEGYYYKIYNDNQFVCKVIVTDKPLREVCIDWLNKNFSNMDIVESKDKPESILYRYVANDNILIWDKKDNHVYVSIDKIWSFFQICFMGYDEIQELTQDWLSESYNLKGVTTWGNFSMLPNS